MVNAQRISEGVDVFFSYSHVDEELRNELENHLSIMKRLDMISTWHDREIGVGDEWRGAIDEHLNSAQIILLLISADFLSSDYCYDIEMDRAMERHELGDATVIPIILRPVDWKGARFAELQALPTNAEPVTSKNGGSHDDAFYDVAKGIRKEIEKQKSMPISQKSGPRTIIVDQMHRGDYPSIAQAIDAANPGDCIKIRHGLYQESIIINKPLEIIGEGERDEIEIRAKDRNAITFLTDYGKVANLTIRQMSQGDFNCVDIWYGRLLIEECDISSQGAAGVVIHEEADPRLRKNQISDNRGFGVIITGEGLGLLEGNQLLRNETSILIENNSRPIIRNNNVKLNRMNGILITENCQCLVEENDVSNNAKIGIEIRSGSNPTLRKNNIHDNEEDGIYITMSAGTIEENDIFQNNVGVNIDASGDPILRKNNIHDNEGNGVHISASIGTLEENDIFQNNIGVNIDVGSNPLLRKNKIHSDKSYGIDLDNAQGTIDENDIFDNDAGIRIWQNCSSIIRRNRIHNSKGNGVSILRNIQCSLGSNKIFDNGSNGVSIHSDSTPTLRSNLINNNGLAGISIDENSGGTFEYNDLRNNKRGAWSLSDETKSRIKSCLNYG